MDFRTRGCAPAWLAVLATSLLIAAPCGADETPADAPPAPRPPHARGELQGTFGAQAGSSSWPGDPIALTTLQVAWRFHELVAPFFMGRTGYGVVNERSLLTLAIGLQVWVVRSGALRPYLRAAVEHQHEEPTQSVQRDPFGALLGVGDGIRHRAGGDFAAGTDVMLHHDARIDVYARIEAVADWFPDPRGPAVYGLGSAALGISHAFF